MAEHRSKRKRSSRHKTSKKLLKQFSTLSEGTLHSPSLSLCLELVSKLYFRHITLRDGCVESRRDKEWEEKFDVDNYLAKRFNTYMTYPCVYIGGPIIFKQERKRSTVCKPSFEIINSFLIGIFKKLHLNVESSIVSLIYTERLMDKRHISLTLRNWRPILIASILTASKVWDDLSSWNIEFSNLLPILSLSNINKLEGLYLQALQYDLYISSSEYAKYYFALRGLKNTKTQHIPRYYLDMKIAKSDNNKRKKRNKVRKISNSYSINSSINSTTSATSNSTNTKKKNHDLNESLSRRARDFEKKSIMNHAKNIKLDQTEYSVDGSIMEEQKYPPNPSNDLNNSILSAVSGLSAGSNNLNSDGELTSSAESNKSDKSSNHSNLSAASGGSGNGLNGYNKHNIENIIKEEDEEQYDDDEEDEEEEKNNHIHIKRSKGIILKPKKATNKPSTQLPLSMPSNLQKLRPVNG